MLDARESVGMRMDRKPGRTRGVRAKVERKNGISRGRPALSSGLKIQRVFSTPGVNPFDAVEWDKRKAVIADEHGKVIFEQDNVETLIAYGFDRGGAIFHRRHDHRSALQKPGGYGPGQRFVFNQKNAERLKQSLDSHGVPNARHLFEGVGHGLPIEKSDEVNCLLREWFTTYKVLQSPGGKRIKP